MKPLTKLFTPIRIGGLELPNRLVMSPMTTDYAGDDLLPSPRLLDYLEERARGGVGLITLEACSIDRRHREVLHSMHFSDDAVIAGHRALTDRVHAAGARVQPQLVHPGPDSMSPLLDGNESLGPSVIPSYLTGHPCRELRVDEIQGIVQQYGEAARRIRDAGYDGLELHAAHGYMLLGSFLSPLRNRRNDEYGGRKLESRIRIVVEVLRSIQAHAGDDFPITLRVSGYERAPGGRSIQDTQRMAPLLVEAGVAAFHVSGGSIDRYVSQIVTGSHYADAHNLAAAVAVKQVVDVPVMTVGRIHDPILAEQILERGQADLVVMGRPLLADPELPSKAREGRLAEIRRCISCQHCIDSMERLQMGCAVNGRSGREGELSFARAKRAKRVVVVGGGPAGLEAARVAALRGYKVTLYERANALGGALVPAATVHPENQPLLDFLLREVSRGGVDVRLGYEATAAGIARLGADAVMVATGGRLVTPRLPGDELPHVWSGALLRQMLSGSLPASESHRLAAWQRAGLRALGSRLERWGTPSRVRSVSRVWLPLGRRVAIVGADLAAVELAEFLAARGRAVQLLEAGEKIAPEVGGKRRTEHMDRLDRLGVSVNTGVECQEISRDGVMVGVGAHEPRLVEADSVILAGEVVADTRFFDAIRESTPEAHAIGDCTGLGLIAKATAEAVRAACSI